MKPQMVTMTRSEAEKREPQLAGRFNVIFAGTMGKAQALDAVLDAAALVAKSEPNVQFVFVGGGIDRARLKKSAEDRRLANVIFLPRRPVSEISAVLAMADVLLVHLKNDPLFEITIPSKTQAYLQVGSPILMAVRGDAAALVKAANAGICCAPENPEEIAKAVMYFHAMPKMEREQLGDNGREFYQRELSLKVGTERFDRIFLATVQ